jgi:transposase
MTSITRKPYDTDLSDAQWEIIAPLIVLPTGGAPKPTNLREIINAILYQLRTGCRCQIGIAKGLGSWTASVGKSSCGRWLFGQADGG